MEVVQVVSAADRDSLAAELADRAVVIGPGPAQARYRRPEVMGHAAIQTGCQAIHPGYGFLSERPELPRLCDDNGLVFVGPTPIRAVGVTDQHSQVQLYVEGTEDKWFTFLSVDEPDTDVTIPKAFDDLEGVSYLGGRTLNELFRAERDGTRIAYTTGSLPDVTEGEDNGGFTQVLKVATGPNTATVYLPEDVSPSGVQFSPDGSMVSFTWSADDEDRAVWGVPVGGGTYRKLAEVAEPKSTKRAI